MPTSITPERSDGSEHAAEQPFATEPSQPPPSVARPEENGLPPTPAAPVSLPPFPPPPASVPPDVPLAPAPPAASHPFMPPPAPRPSPAIPPPPTPPSVCRVGGRLEQAACDVTIASTARAVTALMENSLANKRYHAPFWPDPDLGRRGRPFRGRFQGLRRLPAQAINNQKAERRAPPARVAPPYPPVWAPPSGPDSVGSGVRRRQRRSSGVRHRTEHPVAEAVRARRVVRRAAVGFDASRGHLTG